MSSAEFWLIGIVTVLYDLDWLWLGFMYTLVASFNSILMKYFAAFPMKFVNEKFKAKNLQFIPQILQNLFILRYK